MKYIVVHTDFSKSAAAIAYAANLARVTSSSVLLLHVYQMPLTMTDFPLVVIPFEDLKKSVDAGLENEKKEAQERFPDIHFETESRLGASEEEVAAVAIEREAFCIVTAAQKLGALENFIIGDEVIPLIKTSRIPVIAIPGDTAFGAPQNIVLAIDLSHTDTVPAEVIIAIVNKLKAHLHIIHVETEADERDALPRLMKKFAALKITYHTISNPEVEEGIKNYLLQSNAHLLILLPHKHNFYERLFSKGHLTKIITEVWLPVLCINE